MTQGLYMELYFGFSGRTVKVELDGNQLCMAMASDMGQGLCEIKMSFF